MTSDPTSTVATTPASQASRRAVLVGAGVAVVAGAAGFGWYSLAGPPPRGTAPAGNYPAPSGAATPASLATVAEIPEGGGLVLADQQVVLTRESGDKVHCFTAVCTHQGCLVAQVAAGKITCPCHGSAFDATTGAVVNGPATTALAAVPVTVVNGSIYPG